MRAFHRRRPVLVYFLLTFAISWTGALAVAAPTLVRGEQPSKYAGILMFPVMILGPCLAGIVLTYILDGASAVRRLFSRMWPGHAAPNWYMAVALPPILIWGVLSGMSRLVSPQFTPSLFWQGVFFGLPAGFIEEIGWSGFALPRMIQGHRLLPESALLGFLWGLWHMPVIDYLGTATPHGRYLLLFFVAFIAALTGLRVIIAALYASTGSLLLAQLVHASSTGALVAFSPAGITPAGEAYWYLGYAAALWIVVIFAVLSFRQRLTGMSPHS